MLNIEELKYIREKLADMELEESDTDMNMSIVNKISDILNKADESKQCLWSFYWDCGRQGDVEGIFKATKNEYFKWRLGEHGRS